jgi:hypothetical protein
MKLPKLKYWYHATDIDTANKIIECGYLIPQAHKDNMTLGVFFANSARNAGQWCLMRGITDYVIFKIPRNRFDSNKMFLGGADRMPKELNMICMRHQGPVKVLAQDGTVVNDSREFNMPGCKIITDGTKKLAIKLVDIKAFEEYIESNPALKQMIEKELELQK